MAMATRRQVEDKQSPGKPGATGRSAGAGNRGEDKREADKIGPGTFADDGAEPEKVTRGAPPKPVKRYSHAG